MQEPALSQLLETAVAAATAAGKHALENKDRRTETMEIFAHDIKLVLDAECQKVAEEVIAQTFPDHGILGEEASYESPDNAYEWVIDPIDGTMNYTHGFPYWCCSIAVRHNQKVLAGCVYAPEYDACYTAHLEDVARLNGEPIQPAEIQHLEDALLFTGISKHMEHARDIHFGRFQTLALNTQKLRINGSAALDICHVAAGSSDGYFETSIYLWDFAAAALIAERAGAVVSLHPTEDNTYTVICTTQTLLDQLLDVHARHS